ncbi:MAG: ABC transporter permease [Lachnospiraceae bacterium]|nr:ABC transporter permease [Lachnospiraceae bacterium]
MKKRQMYIRMITASLLRRRSRMIIALLAIAIGATILSGLVTIYIDVPRQMGAQFRSYGANMILTSSGDNMTEDEIDNALNVVPYGLLVGATAYRYETVRINDRPVLAGAANIEEVKKTSPFWDVDGEWPEAEKEILVGKRVAETYNLKPGKKVTCTYSPETESDEVILDNYIDFTVTGILNTGGSEEDYVYMTLADMASLTGTSNTYNICEVSISGTSSELNNIIDKMKEAEENVNPKIVKRLAESETAVLTKLQSLVLLVTIVVLALTMISVATTMTAVVAERRKEIGLRKALGAGNGSIIAEFMGEGIVLGAAGGLLGSIFGFIFAEAVSMNIFNSTITLVWWLIPVTILSSVLVTALACMIPIKSATQVDPALVLKGE